MNNLRSYDVAIIGGGLAGLSLAIQCAAKNISVALFEKEIYPFHKVCGEYISLESKPFLESLGIPFSSLQLPVIRHLQVSDAKGNAYDFELPLGGFGISRYKLDEMLYNIAVEKGAQVFTGLKVTDVVFESDAFNLVSTIGNVQAKVVAGAWGKRSNMDIKWKRSLTQDKPGKLNNYVGIKYHIKYDHPADRIVLHNFKNGYCGMSKIEDDKSCLCYLTTAENLKKSDNSIRRMEQEILNKNPHLEKIFSSATFFYEQPETISQISFSKKLQVENHVLMPGDSAGMISPLCGNGMSMALHSSKLSFVFIEQYLSGKISRKELEAGYEKSWKNQFSKRLATGRTVQKLFGGETTTAIFLKIMNALPVLANTIIRSTHGKGF